MGYKEELKLTVTPNFQLVINKNDIKDELVDLLEYRLFHADYSEYKIIYNTMICLKNPSKYKDDFKRFYEIAKKSPNNQLHYLVELILEIYPDDITIDDMQYLNETNYYMVDILLKNKKEELLKQVMFWDKMDADNVAISIIVYFKKLEPIFGLNVLKEMFNKYVYSSKSYNENTIGNIILTFIKYDHALLFIDFEKIKFNIIFSRYKFRDLNFIKDDINNIKSHEDIFTLKDYSKNIYQIAVAQFRKDIFNPLIFDWDNLSEYIIIYEPELLKKYVNYIDNIKYKDLIKKLKNIQ